MFLLERLFGCFGYDRRESMHACFTKPYTKRELVFGSFDNIDSIPSLIERLLLKNKKSRNTVGSTDSALAYI